MNRLGEKIALTHLSTHLTHYFFYYKNDVKSVAGCTMVSWQRSSGPSHNQIISLALLYS